MHVGFSLAAALAFLVLVWHDTLRGATTSRLHYAIRSLLCAVVTLIIVRNMFGLAAPAASGSTWIDVVAVVSGVAASIWFTLRALGWQRRPREEEQLPSIFSDSNDEQ